MQDTNTHTGLDVSSFRNLIDELCVSASADFTAARQRLERLRREGPERDDG